MCARVAKKQTNIGKEKESNIGNNAPRRLSEDHKHAEWERMFRSLCLPFSLGKAAFFLSSQKQKFFILAQEMRALSRGAGSQQSRPCKYIGKSKKWRLEKDTSGPEFLGGIPTLALFFLGLVLEAARPSFFFYLCQPFSL